MSRKTLLGLAATLLLGGCATTPCCYAPAGDVARQEYIHEYGLEVPQQDWIARGGNGEVVTTKNSGVVVRSHYRNGRLHGETTYSFPHSNTTERTERYSHGTLQSEIDHYATGIPAKEHLYLDPQREEILTWFEDGTPRSNERLMNHCIVDAEYYTPSNEIDSRVVDGEGLRVRRDSQGTLLSHDRIAKGNMVERTTFDVLGHPREMATYRDSAVHGQRRTFLPGGEPNTVEQWVNGIQHGITVQYRNGEKYAEVPYVNGHRHGMEKRFRSGDQLCEEVRWRFGERYDDSRVYLSDNSPPKRVTQS